MDSDKLAECVERLLEDLKATDIVTLEVRHLTSITDYMIIASGRSARHVRALAEKVIEGLRGRGIRPFGVEGESAGEWVLVDLQDVIVHLMLPRAREFYNLEKLWDIQSPSAQES